MSRRKRTAPLTHFDLSRLMGEGTDPSMRRQLNVPVSIADIEKALIKCAGEIANIVENNAGDLVNLGTDIVRGEDGDLQAPDPFDDSNVNDLGIYASAYTDLSLRLGTMQAEIERDREAASSRIEGKRQAA